MHIVPGWLRKSPNARRFAVLAALMLAWPTACSDRSSNPLTPQGTGGRASFAVTASYSRSVSDPGLPINRIRLTARDRTTNQVVGTQLQDVNSGDAQWTLSLDVTLASNTEDLVITMELIHTEGGVDTVQWTGTTDVHAVVGQQQDVAHVDLFRGPPDNLTVTSISIARPVPSLVEGGTTTLTATVQGSTTAQIFWSTLDPTIATVSSAGIVTTTLPGNARIVASAGPHSDTAIVAVRARVASVAITPTASTLTSIGAETTLQAHVLDPRAAEISGATVTWTSGDTLVLASLGGGHFRAVSNGTATVTATVDGSPTIHNTATIAVAQRVSAVTIDPPTATLASIGAHQAFTATGRDANGNVVAGSHFTWSSTVPTVATVDAGGVATAASIGNTHIRATATDSVAGDASLTVLQSVSSVVITPGIVTLTALQDTIRLSARAVDGTGAAIDGKTFTWTSTNPGVASVDATGKVTALTPGAATIRATSDGVVGSADISVEQVVTRVDVTPTTASATAVNQTVQFSALARDHRNNTVAGRTATWTSSNTAVATVNTSGLATALGGGTANITATVDGVSGAGVLTVTASAHVAFVTVAPSAPSVAIGSTVQLTATTQDSSHHELTGRTITWRSADSTKATVSATGLVTALHTGPVIIIATSEGVNGTASVTVTASTASSIAKVSGDNQTAEVSVQVPNTIVVKVTDAQGNGVSGVSVVWTASNGGSALPTPVFTDTAGLARTSWTLGTTTGAQTLQAQAQITGTPSVTFNATATTHTSVSRTWVGGAPANPRDWSEPANWAPQGTPAENDVVTIPVTTNQPQLLGNVNITGVTVLTGATLDIQGFNLFVHGNVDAGTTIIGSGTLTIDAAGTLRGNVPALNITASVTVNGTTNVEGNLFVNPGGTLTLNGNTVNVDHDFETSGGGKIIETNALDVLKVSENAVFRTANGAGTLTAGRLIVGKQFTVICFTNNDFVPSGTHTTVLNGSGAQNISMACPTYNSFNNLELSGSGNTVSIPSPVGVKGNLNVLNGTIDGGSVLTVAGNITTLAGTSLQVSGLAIGGTMTVAGTYQVLNTVFFGSNQPIPAGLAYQNVQVLGGVPLGGTAHFTGATAISLNLAITNAGAALTMNGQTVTVAGRLTTSLGGVLVENNANDVLDVAGNTTFTGGDQSGKLTAGQLKIAGNFTVTCSTGTDFVASGTHTTTFDAPPAPVDPNPIRTVDVGCSSATQNRFQNMAVVSPTGTVNIASNPTYVMGTFTMEDGTLGGSGAITIVGDADIGGSSAPHVTIATMTLKGPGGTEEIYGPSFSPGLLIMAGGTSVNPQPLIPLNYQSVQIDGFVIVTDTTTVILATDLTLTTGSILTVQYGSTLDVYGSITMNAGSRLNNPGSHVYYRGAGFTDLSGGNYDNSPTRPPS